jgi:hypothetical protein
LTSRERDWVLTGVAATGFLLLSWTAHRYWDEFFYLYSSTTFTPRELMRLDVTADLFPQGYFSGKIGHIVLLRMVAGIVGTGQGALLVLEALYALLMLATLAAALGVYRELLDEPGARRAALVLLFLPVTLYLSYKLLSEVPSLLLATLGSWAFLRAFRAGTRWGERLLLGAATLGLGAGMLCRATVVLGFAGLVLGLLAAGDPRFRPREVLGRAVLIGAGALALHAGVLHYLGGSELRVLLLAHAVAASTKLFERATALALFLGAFAVVLPFALGQPRPPMLRLAWVWLAATMLPNLVGHEPRYYAPAILPLAIIAATGLGRIAARVPGRRQGLAWGVGLALLTLVDRAAVLPLMPSELDQASLGDLIGRLTAQHPTATIIVPWASDYSFLRFVFPHARVRLAMSAMPSSRYTAQGRWGEMPPVDQAWASPARYIGAMPALDRSSGPWYYVGWTYNPVMLRVRGLLRDVGVHLLDDPRRIGWHDHLTGSWIWADPRLALQAIGGEGQYEVFRIVPLRQSPDRTSITSASATTKARSPARGSIVARPVKLPNAGRTAIRSLRRKQGRRSR